MRVRARHYATGEVVDVICAGGVVREVTPPGPGPADREAGWVAPALFDLQINGCDGHSFNSERLDVDSVRHVVRVCRRHGIGGLCPTLVTASFAALHHGMTTLARACDSVPEVARAVPAIHLEGPYISAEDGPRGAHPRAHVRPPDTDEFARLQEAAGGRIRLVTLAPEQDGALAFIEWLARQGVVAALGHTAASPARLRDAVRAGARLSTHLGNGCHALIHRHDNHIWEQLANDVLCASLICDGHHLPPAMVKCLLRAKTPARTILTCDASSLAGLPPGRYSEWGQELEVQPGGKVVVVGSGLLAGSGVFLDTCLDFVLSHGLASLPEALAMAGAQPRALLGLPPRSLEPGQPAELVLFEHGPGGAFRVVDVLLAA